MLIEHKCTLTLHAFNESEHAHCFFAAAILMPLRPELVTKVLLGLISFCLVLCVAMLCRKTRQQRHQVSSGRITWHITFFPDPPIFGAIWSFRMIQFSIYLDFKVHLNYQCMFHVMIFIVVCLVNLPSEMT